ncbi:HIT family protein [Candidatus Kaiserbacteria bacterium CG_4_9_14_0_2_um_filter_41_32]|uniref:HIT family protein n=1 Tax=Candidatus Kaiserbacteria bacterium CG_4_9_14_0_2_um_filter_41_32 TaxID=1974601 RepID=A0A2M8FE78_9BACT|nr:MAG: HIT family protein [Candidatus Kaiserbacteria bacterium CG_4_9_14_0_2_um_filter_41_32]
MKTESEPSIFTRIIKREIPADIIYEDDSVIAFFTIEPINYGHTLVVPKKPFVNIFDGDDETLSQMMSVAKKVSQALMDEKFAEGVNIVMNNGVASGQEIFHAHIHVIPRHKGDGFFKKPSHIVSTKIKMSEMADRLSKALKE